MNSSEDNMTQLRLNVQNLKTQLREVRSNLVRTKVSASEYSKTGYSSYATRPVRDISKWMAGVNDSLELILEELESR